MKSVISRTITVVVLLSCFSIGSYFLIAALSYASFAAFGDVGYRPNRLPHERWTRDPVEFVRKANFKTGWIHRGVIQPVYEGSLEYSGDYACELWQGNQVPMAATWWNDGKLPASQEIGGMLAGTFTLKLKDEILEPASMATKWLSGPRPDWYSLARLIHQRGAEGLAGVA